MGLLNENIFKPRIAKVSGMKALRLDEGGGEESIANLSAKDVDMAAGSVSNGIVIVLSS